MEEDHWTIVATGAEDAHRMQQEIEYYESLGYKYHSD